MPARAGSESRTRSSSVTGPKVASYPNPATADSSIRVIRETISLDTTEAAGRIRTPPRHAHFVARVWSALEIADFQTDAILLCRQVRSTTLPPRPMDTPGNHASTASVISSDRVRRKSNPEPPACKASALPVELGAHSRGSARWTHEDSNLDCRHVRAVSCHWTMRP